MSAVCLQFFVYFQMQCFPIYSMLLAVGNPTVDYMSLDIEGAEFDVSLMILSFFSNSQFLFGFSGFEDNSLG